MDETHPALHPAHRSGELDRIAAKRIGGRGQARGPLGVDHHLLDLVELPGKPRGQTVRQQAERRVALRAVPASDARPARALARVGAVAGQRTAPVPVIGAALKGCIAPRPGPNVCLAGKPRFVAKLHRPWPGGVCPPRGPTPFSFQGAPRLRRRPSPRQVPRMWTRPADRAPPGGPCGQAMEKLRFPTACPHSALSRPQPHPFCNNDRSKRRWHRLRSVPGLPRPLTQSVYGTIRSNPVGVPREKARPCSRSFRSDSTASRHASSGLGPVGALYRFTFQCCRQSEVLPSRVLLASSSNSSSTNLITYQAHPFQK